MVFIQPNNYANNSKICITEPNSCKYNLFEIIKPQEASSKIV